MWTMNWDRAGVERTVEAAVHYKMDFIEIALLNAPAVDAAHTRGLLERHGMRAVASLGLPERNWASVNPEGAVDHLKQALDVAKAMGVTPLTNEQLGLKQPGWGGKAPLWYYVLKEAELINMGRKLGPVGGRIVAEVILGVMALDPESYFNLKPAFQWQEKKAIGDVILLANALDPRSRIVLPDDELEPIGPQPLEPDEEINPEATSPVSSLSLVE